MEGVTEQKKTGIKKEKKKHQDRSGHLKKGFFSSPDDPDMIGKAIFDSIDCHQNPINKVLWRALLKFIFSKKVTKIDKIFTMDLTLFSKCQIDGEDFVNFCGLL